LRGWPGQYLEAHPATVLDGTGTIVYASPAFLRLTGLPAEKVVGVRAPRTHADPQIADALDHGLELVLSGAMARLEMSSGEVQLPARNAALVRCRFTYHPIPEDRPQHHVFLFEPIGDDAERLQQRTQRLEGALYEIKLTLNRVGVSRGALDTKPLMDLAALTERELDVMKLILDGRSNPEVAALLRVSMHTVKSHAQAIFRKLGVRSRAELLSRFVRGSELP
jgi:ATP/maltotriose-dependent transcriptional regulator MalT